VTDLDNESASGGVGCRDGFQWRPREERRHESEAEERGMLLTKTQEWVSTFSPFTIMSTIAQRPALLLLLLAGIAGGNRKGWMDDETARSSLARARLNHFHRITDHRMYISQTPSFFISSPPFPGSISFSPSQVRLHNSDLP
jgi:hypothetical protein